MVGPPTKELLRIIGCEGGHFHEWRLHVHNPRSGQITVGVRRKCRCAFFATANLYDGMNLDSLHCIYAEEKTFCSTAAAVLDIPTVPT